MLVTLFLLDARISIEAEAWGGPFGRMLQRGSVIPLVTLIVYLLGARELIHLMSLKGLRPHRRFAYFMIAVLLLSPWLSAAGWLGSGAAQLEGLYWQVVWLVVAGIGIAALTVIRKNPEDAVYTVGGTLLPILYLGLLGSFIVQLRCGRDLPAGTGLWLLLALLLITKVSDIGAYFVGSLAGRHKLAPAVSPGKTVEGAIGGLLASAIVSVAIVLGAPVLSALALAASGQADFSDLGLSAAARWVEDQTATSPVLAAIFFGVCVSAGGQVGDLLESCFKRAAQVKDSGKIIPQFGGILDLIDSPVLAVPVGWFLLTAG